MTGADWTFDAVPGRAPPRGWRLALLLTLAALMVAGILWARFAVIEEVTRATGRVIPSGEAQVVESLEGGIVAEILVREGAEVAAREVLIRIDDTAAGADLGELTARAGALRVRIARLAAELAGDERPDFSATGLSESDPRLLQELALFDSRRAAELGQRAVIEAQVRQRAQEIAELERARDRTEERIALMSEEIALRTASGVVPRAQILPLERERTGLRQERDSHVSRIAQAREALVEAEARLTDLKLQRRAEINTARAEAESDLAVIEEALRRAADVVARADLRAPVDGVISVLNVNTVGSVIAPGEEVLRIVPARKTLEVRGRVAPRDIGFIAVDDPARIKLTAYDFTIYGSLAGRVARISPDAAEDPQTGEVYYPVIIATEEDALEHQGARLPIRPGMVAEIDIQSGEHTVLDTLLKPFVKARYEALRER
jgi:adhesin transport system membrane fusion protein